MRSKKNAMLFLAVLFFSTLPAHAGKPSFCERILTSARGLVRNGSVSLLAAHEAYEKARANKDELAAARSLLDIVADNADALGLSSRAKAGIEMYQRILADLQIWKDSPGTRIVATMIRSYAWANGPYLFRWISNRLDRLRLIAMAEELELELLSGDPQLSLMLHVPIDDFFRKVVDENLTLNSSIMRSNMRRYQRGSVVGPLAVSAMLTQSGYQASELIADTVLADVPEGQRYPELDFISDAERKASLSIDGKKIVVVYDRNDLSIGAWGRAPFNEVFLSQVDPMDSPLFRDLGSRASEFKSIAVGSFKEAADALNQNTDADVRILSFHGSRGEGFLGSQRLSHEIDGIDWKPATKPGSSVVYLSCEFAQSSAPKLENELWIRLARKLVPDGKAYGSNIVTLMSISPFDPNMKPSNRNPYLKAYGNYRAMKIVDDQVSQSLFGPFASAPEMIQAYKHKTDTASAGSIPGFRVYDGKTDQVMLYPMDGDPLLKK